MKILELKDICGYLPYGLRIMRPPTNVPVVAELLYIRKDFTILSAGHIDTYRAVLRPMSDLTKEITNKGEKFVPLVELAKMSINWVKLVWKVSDNGLFVYDLCGCNGDVIKFYYRPRCFYVSEPTITERANDQSILFDKLNEWMFDYRGLISAGLAIDVNTLPENPYER